MSWQTGTVSDLIYANTATATEKTTWTAEAVINDTTGMGAYPFLQANFFLPGGYATGKTLHIVARGIMSTTGTPTFTWTIRLGAAGSTTAAIILGSAAITAGNGVANQIWSIDGHVTFRSMGAAGANSTVQGVGVLVSSGTAAPYTFPMYGGAATPGTVATVDTSIVNYFSVNAACSASSASNKLTLQQLIISALN